MYGDNLKEAFEIRNEVFVCEQGMNEKDVFDDYDKVSVHAVVYNEENKPVASGRIAFDGTQYRIGKIAVRKKARGQKLGDFLVRMLIDKGYIAGADAIYVRAQLHAIGFYEKIGFSKDGEVFTDIDGLKVQPMILKKGALCKECQKKSCEDCSSK
jgi:predicted GNAT family N-acyltransferase